MFDSGVNPKNAHQVSLNEKNYVVKDNVVYLPLETTINKPFSEAWAMGADGFLQSVIIGWKIDLIDVRKAWEEFPPANLATNTKASEPPSVEKNKSIYW